MVGDIATTLLLALFVLVVSVALTLVGLVLVQRRIPLELRQSHNATIGIIYGTLHVTFGVIIGFTAFLVLDKYNESRHAVAREARDIVQIHRLAEGFPEAQRDQIQDVARSYARVVVDEEWPLMREGQTSSSAETLAQELGSSTQDFEPSTESEKALYAQGLMRVVDLQENREVRLLNAREGLPPILWVALGILVTIIMLFTFFLGMESARLHRWAVGMLAVGLILTMFTVIALDDPFGGEFRVGPERFESALETIEGNAS